MIQGELIDRGVLETLLSSGYVFGFMCHLDGQCAYALTYLYHNLDHLALPCGVLLAGVSSRNCNDSVGFVEDCRGFSKLGTEDMHSALRCAVSFNAARERCCKVVSCQTGHRIQPQIEPDPLYPKRFWPVA